MTVMANKATGAVGTSSASGSGETPLADPTPPTKGSVEAAIVAQNRLRAANVVNGETPANGSSSSKAVAAKGASTPVRSGTLGDEFVTPFSSEPTREVALAGGSGGQEEIGERSDLDLTPLEEEWPLPGSTLMKRGFNRCLTLAHVLPSSNPQRGSSYYPTTKGGKQLARIRLAEDICLS
jgi:hypothetical protein